MNNLFGSETGLIHLIFALLAVFAGTWVLLDKKGSRRHRRMGYVYLFAMIGTNVSAFLIYRLFGAFGLFHYMAVFSLATTLAGIIPIWFKSNFKGWKYYHFSFMYWSVIGLYMALVAEIMTRIPESPFYGMLILAMVLVMTLAVYSFRRNKESWKKVLGIK